MQESMMVKCVIGGRASETLSGVTASETLSGVTNGNRRYMVCETTH